MNIFRYIQALLAAEIRLMENFIKIAEYYKSEPGIYYGCQEMASISNDHLKELRRESAKFWVEGILVDRLDSMISSRTIGQDLTTDLHFMWLLTMDAEILYNLLLHAARDNSESDLELMCSNFDHETEKQSQWLMYRLNIAVRGTTVEA